LTFGGIAVGEEEIVGANDGWPTGVSDLLPFPAPEAQDLRREKKK
jgi:hypothetical protein